MAGPADGSFAQQTGRGLMWSGLGFAANKVLTFVTLLVLARLLVPSEFGVVAAISVFLVIVEMISDLGMKAVVIYEQEEGVTDRVRTAFSINMVFAAVLTGLGLLVAPLVAGFFRIEEHTDLLRLAVLNVMLASLGNMHDAILVRAIDFRRRVRPEIARGLVRGAVGITLAALGFGAASLVWSLLAGTLAWVLVLWVMIPLRPRLKLDRGIARSMRSYGGAAVAHTFLAEISRVADITAIGRVLGERALGIYTVALRVPELLMRTVSWQLSSVLFPALSRRRVTAGDTMAATSIELTRLQALYLFPVAAWLATLATPLAVVLFSETWRDAGPVMAAFAIHAVADVMFMPLGDAMKATGHQRALVWVNGLSVPATIVVVILAAPEGILTVAWSLVGVQAAFSLMVMIAAIRTIGVRARDIGRAFVPGLLAAAGAAAGAGAVRAAWDAEELIPVALASLAAGLGAVVALRIFAAGTFHDLAGTIRAALPTRAVTP